VKIFFQFGILITLSLIPFSAAGQVLLDPDFIDENLEAVSDAPFTIAKTDGGFLLTLPPGISYLLYPVRPARSLEAYKLAISLHSDEPMNLTVVPNATIGGNYTYELAREILPGKEPKVYRFSLNHPLFKNVNDIALKFTAEKPTKILLREISFQKQTAFQKIVQFEKDYFQAAPYSGFTVNIFPTPRIFGRSAFYYFIPVFLLFVALMLFSRRYRRAALIGLLGLWLLTDMRMNYEFLSYAAKDYKTWIKPAPSDKKLRTYGDFYAFADWLRKNLPKDRKEIGFYYLDNEHYPRLLQYYVYPIRVMPKKEDAKTFVVFHRGDMKDKLLSEGAMEIESFKEDSGIFIKTPLPLPLDKGEKERR